jgi:trehalose utilization protein
MNPHSTLLAFAMMSLGAFAAEPVVRVLVWDEQQPEQKKAYGEKFLGETLAAHLATRPGLTVTNANMAQPESGLPETLLDNTDVVIWWSHVKNRELKDDLAERVVSRVHSGRMGLVALHSAHWAKPFVRLMQERAKSDAALEIQGRGGDFAKIEFTNLNPIGRPVLPNSPVSPQLTRREDGSYSLFLPGCIFPAWRNDGMPSHVKTLLPDHPLAEGLPSAWDIPRTEMYGGPFHVPKPDATVFEEKWDKGESFQSGSVWTVGKGRVVYFRPGHETWPVFHQAEPLRVVENAARWAAPARR